jgi:hypothetical protein
LRDDAVTFGAVDVIDDVIAAMLFVFLVFLVPVIPDDYGGRRQTRGVLALLMWVWRITA